MLEFISSPLMVYALCVLMFIVIFAGFKVLYIALKQLAFTQNQLDMPLEDSQS